ncbi:uncharacterized protein LACBIDRAFT_326096 [Laccaria bicolor S238N-H82]|uniref:Predicted protein n=1 Tax=Laccaria bicolor (strain S238N-H82 / ATCC MYA-4686) TaxID=486041 RepID=B0D7A2_LACBS|nr:uncharacterized protein LACBIDRAFT_326096 [Laccaria bicolor S238N-H82]EDR09359.1 predicted protein [Laccaria bicolor S238N-H82]|eukprot:XP_001879708.1 predicted protein [Laccaria bicolor S238N-H82]
MVPSFSKTLASIDVSKRWGKTLPSTLDPERQVAGAVLVILLAGAESRPLFILGSSGLFKPREKIAASTSLRIESLLSKDAVVTINGKASSGADLAGQLIQARFPGSKATISFKEAVQVPAGAQQPPVAGSVGVFFTSTTEKPEVIDDVPPTQTLTASVNLVIADATISRDVAVPGGTIKELNAVFHLGSVHA